MKDNIIVEDNSIFEQLENSISNEERLILRLQGFCEEILNFEDDCTEVEDREASIMTKATKIANKLFNNVLEDSEYDLKSFDIYPVYSKIEFTISKDEDLQSFNLMVENDGFELEQV